MNVIQCPFVKFHVHDDNGYPASGWRLYTFRAGTDEPLTAYKDASGSVEYGAFVLMNSRGEPDGDGIFLEEGAAYKLILKRPDGSTAWTQPYVLSSGSSGGSSVPSLLAARSLYGNTSSSTGEAGTVQIDSVLTDGNNSIPSSKAVYGAVEAAVADVVHNSGEQAIDGSLSVSGVVNAGSLSIAGENVDSRFVRVDGHQGQSLVGRSATGSGTVSDVPIAESIDSETDGSSVPTVAAVRGALSGLDDGLVKTNANDAAGYLAGKVVGDGNTADVDLVDNKLVVSVDSQLVARIGANDGLSMVNADDSMGYLSDKVEAGVGVAVEVTASNKLKVSNTQPDTMMTKAHAVSSVPGFLSSLMQAGTGINMALSADMEKIVLTATGSAVGGFYWKGTWDAEGTYNVNNAVWYFDHTGELPVSRLYVATTQNQGVNPFTDAGIGTGTCWSCMMAVDYMGDQFVMLDSTDTQSGYLADKLKAGQYVTLTRTADANGAWYTVDCAAPYAVKTNGTTKTYADLDGKIEIVGTGGTTTYWYGTQLMVQSITLGEGATNAFRGDQGKIAYDHSQAAHAPANADNTQAALNAASAKTTPVDADVIPILDSAAGNAIKRVTWASVKATLKAYFDGLYASATDYVSKTTETTQSIISAITMRRISASCLLDDLTISEQSTERIRIGTRPPSDNSVITVGVERVLNGNGHIFTDSSRFSPSIDGLAQASYDSMPATGGINNIDHMISYQSRIEHQGSGRLNRLYGFGVNHSHSNGPVSNSYGFYCGVSSGNVIPDNTYGLYISPLVGNAKYGIYGEGPDTWKNNGSIVALSAKIGEWSAYPGQPWARFGHASKDHIGGYGFLHHESGACMVGFERETSFSVQSRQTGVGGDTVFSVDDAGTHVKKPDADDNSDKAANTAWVKDVAAPIGDYVSKSVTDTQSIASSLNASVAHTGSWAAVDDMARFGHKNHNTTGGFGFLQTHSGGVYMCAPSGEGIHFRINNDEKNYMDPNGYFHFLTPPTSDDADTVPTTAWVKDVALQLGSGLSAGASVVVRQYSAANSYAANTIYLEY